MMDRGINTNTLTYYRKFIIIHINKKRNNFVVSSEFTRSPVNEEKEADIYN